MSSTPINKFCCEEMVAAILDGVIIDYVFDQDSPFRIHGIPSFMNDGEGHLDDMTEEHPIGFCPFCGHALKNR